MFTIALLATAQQPPDESESVLRRTRDRLLTDLERFPRYTCVQTVTRSYYRPHAQGASCAKLIAEQKGPVKFWRRGWDRLRLEVAVVGRANAYSWVGAPRFESGTLDQLGGHGPFNSGDFGPFLQSIFSRAQITFLGVEKVDQQQRFAYSYDIPLDKSTYQVKNSDGWAPTAHSGTFLLDPMATDIVRLTVRTAELSEKNPDCQAINDIEYGRTQIHDRMVLIPRQTELITIGRDSSETESRTVYSNCREYASKTRLFIDPSSVTSTAGAIDKAAGFPNDASQATPTGSPAGSTLAAGDPAETPPGFFPAGLHFRARIITPIDSDTAAGGDPIEAVLRDPIRDKSKRQLAPAGARLYGRLLALEQRSEWADYFWVSIQFESIDLNGRTLRLRAVPDKGGTTEVAVRGSRSMFAPDQATPINAFFFLTEHLHLKKFDWDWTTTLPVSDDEVEKPGSEH